MIRRKKIVGAWYSDVTLDGDFGGLIPTTGILINKERGEVDFPLPGRRENLLFFKLHKFSNLFFAGQGGNTGIAWVRNVLEDSYRDLGLTFGVSPIAFWKSHIYIVRDNSTCEVFNLSDFSLYKVIKDNIGTQGIRYINEQGYPVWGDFTYDGSHTKERLAEWTVVGGLTVGQSYIDGCVGVYDVNVNSNVIQRRKVIVPGECQFVRAYNDISSYAVATIIQRELVAHFTWFNAMDLDSMSDEIGPVVHPPIPIPEPLPMPNEFNWNTVSIIGGSPDVRNWKEVTKITSLNLRPDGVYPLFSARSTWPESGGSEAGRIQFTLWIAMFLDNGWKATGAIPFWNGLSRAGGDIVKDDLIVTNWGMNRKPNVGELVGFFVTQGDARKKDLHEVTERSNIVFLNFPSDYKLFNFEGIPGPTPEPIPNPPNPPDNNLENRLSELERKFTQLQDSALFDGSKVALRSDNSNYLCAENGGGLTRNQNPLAVDRPVAAGWETWTLVKR